MRRNLQQSPYSVFTTMDKKDITEKILKVTLEIIYLLTGEDYSLVNKASQQVGSSHGAPIQPGGSGKTNPPSLSEVPAKSNTQKILDLTNKIIELLTGEVSIRHEDIIVCFSMEEWEYVEGHKDLYKDVMMESQPFPGSHDFPSSENLSMKLNLQVLSSDTACEDRTATLSKPKAKNTVSEDVQEVNNRSTSTKYTQTEPVDYGEGEPCADQEAEVVLMPTDNTLRYPTEVPSPYDQGNHNNCLLTEQIQNIPDEIGSEVETTEDDHIYPPTHLKSTDLTDQSAEWVTNLNFVDCPITPQHINTQYTSSCIIEVASVCEGNVTTTEVYTPTDPKTALYTLDKMEDAPMEWGKDVIYTNIYTPAELTQEDLASIKKELISWKDGSLELQNIYIPPKPMEEKAVSTSGRGDSAQWNGRQPHRDSYPSLVNTSPPIKMEYEEDLVGHYASPGQTQPTHVSVNREHCNIDAIKKEKATSNMSTDDENDHRAEHDPSQMFSCSDCQKSFSSDANLAKHRLMCKGRKPHVCSACGKCFASASYLVIHERIHTGEKPYSCSHCGKSFTRKPDLIRHERIHTGEKPFACPECGKCFTSVSNIFMHRRIHSGEKPFPCAECGKRFIKKSDLVRHEKIHLPQKPLPCSHCGNLFSSKAILSKHMAVHTAETPQGDR
ncbi:uncharacterized protein RB166_018967 isoform 1-T2 [Leptodactylus fuscus]|uniref:uncharacterized protein LOC142183333 n=1 Tax=Leptodactylus fuscus TaxID=238119 RepID=UPI003F4F306D